MAEVKVDLEYVPGDPVCVLVEMFIDELKAAILVPLAGKVLQVQKTIGGKASVTNHEDEIYLVEIPGAKKPIVAGRKRCYHQATQAVAEAGCQNVKVLDLIPEEGPPKPERFEPIPDPEFGTNGNPAKS